MEQLNKPKLLWKSAMEAPTLLVKNGLTPWLLAPVALNAALLVLVIWASFSLSELAMGWFEQSIGSSFFPNWVIWVVAFAFRMVLVLLYFSIYKQLVLVVLAPLLALFGEALDTKLTGRTFPFSFAQLLLDSWRGIQLAMRNLLTEWLLTALLILFAFIPVIGLLAPVFIFFLQAYFVGFSLLDYGLERDRVDVAQSREYLKGRKWMCIGVGVYHNLLFLVPIVGWIFAPVLGMAMATKVYLVEAGIIPAE